jgi:hypothetical protein
MEGTMQIKKINILKELLLALTVLLLLNGCQDEFTEIEELDKEVTINASDSITGLILKTAHKDGSFDNIIDKCSEISIKFPYSITVKGERISVTSIDDMEKVKLQYFHFRNAIMLNYPVTVIFSDYSEAVLSNPGELRNLQNRYNKHDADDDIECIDFIYPIELSIYNTEFQHYDFVKAANDEDIHDVFNDIDDLIVEINYPILMKTLDGDTLAVNNNQELENEINRAMDNCDEDDDIEFDDDDYPGIDLLTSGEWKITLFEDTANQTSSFISFHFEFNPYLNVYAFNASDALKGYWEFDIYDNIIVIEIEFETDEVPLVWLNNEWEILQINEKTIVMQAESDSEGRTKRLTFSKRE